MARVYFFNCKWQGFFTTWKILEYQEILMKFREKLASGRVIRIVFPARKVREFVLVFRKSHEIYKAFMKSHGIAIVVRKSQGICIAFMKLSQVQLSLIL